MAGWSMLSKGCSLDCADITKGCKGGNKGNPSCSQTDNASELKLRCLFDRALSIVSNEAVAMGFIRPMPVLVCKGQSFDLFKLFQVVMKRGGFDLMKGFWIFVVEELGLGLEASPAVKLIYYKYLYGLEKWLRGSRGEGGKLGDELRQTSADFGNFGNLSSELEKEFRTLLSRGNGEKKIDEHKESSRDTPIANDRVPGSLVVHIISDDDDDENVDYCKKNCSEDDDDDVIILDPSVGKEIFNSRKRKRESLSGMLNWVIEIAKAPNHIPVGEVPPVSKWKDRQGDELWAQAIRARDALLERKPVPSCCERFHLQNNQKLHPSMYEDITPRVDQSMERLRCSVRLPALAKARSCSCSSSRSASQSQLINSPKKLGNSPKKNHENSHKELPLVGNNISVEKTAQTGNEIGRRHVLVGRRFQAEVPNGIDMAYESDSKWLGTRTWPLEHKDNDAPVRANYIRKGRPNTCDCELRGSVECVRFHIAENRIKLKLELGPAFFWWRFDRMGEEISLRWTTKQQKKFKNIVRLNPQLEDMSFWDDTRRYFPRKTREELVSYYFNVFVVQRRSYQNRVTPKDVDSDDDESELGSLSDAFGHKAVKFLGSDILICSENKQCTDYMC
ncbi:AT-rich interactive domain-containing protein 2-like [Euphorbia lathyris]|uniref:AT-rich interactive domain-containing protein 2-like n=1 Tax=Euphorbia lathyris TaxID=212925 RepID=UPI003313C857